MAKPSPQHNQHPLLVSLGAAIRRSRKVQGISQEDLALRAGLDRSYMGGVERGEHNLTVISLARVAQALGVALQVLVCEAEANDLN